VKMPPESGEGKRQQKEIYLFLPKLKIKKRR